MNLSFLRSDFLAKYPDNPTWKSILGQFVYLRTYSRFDPTKGRREHWKETCMRVVNYSMSLYTGPKSYDDNVVEAEKLFDLMFNLKLFTAGRTMWIGGTEAATKFPLSNFNCSFTVVDSYEAFIDAFYLMMLGTGVGFRVLADDVAKLAPIKTHVVVAHKPYHPKEKSERLEQTQVYKDSGGVYIIVADSKEGWVDALRIYFETLTSPEPVESIMINYDSVRPQGELLKTFGGRASGHTALRDMFKQIHQVMCRGTSRLTTIQAMDVMNIIGSCVVVGGVRRSSEITLFDIADKDILDAKVDLWSNPEKAGFTYRSMSNNSVYFTSKPTKEQLLDIFGRIINNGEPGFINAEASAKRHPYYAGTNPCAEILLADNGVCNLSEINVAGFTKVVDDEKVLDLDAFEQAVRLATRIGLRMTNVTLELPHWDAVQKRDRLTGVSLTGYVEAMDFLGVDTTDSTQLVPFVSSFWTKTQARINHLSLAEILHLSNQVANAEARNYAAEMRIPAPLLVTSVKPSGTIAQLPTVSSGGHSSYAPYFIRRVRISSFDPLAATMLAVGYPVFPEANTMRPEDFAKLSNFEQMRVLGTAQTWVIEFPIKTSAPRSANTESAVSQLMRYFTLQNNWTDHNTSITITFNPDEVDDIINLILQQWDNYIGVSFLPKSTMAYPLMPYEEITADEYTKRSNAVEYITWKHIVDELVKRESVPVEEDEFDPDCVGGACPVR